MTAAIAATWMMDEAEELFRKTNSMLLQRSRMDLKVTSRMAFPDRADVEGDFDLDQIENITPIIRDTHDEESVNIVLQDEDVTCHLFMTHPPGTDRLEAISYFRSLELKLQLYDKDTNGLPVIVHSSILDVRTQCLNDDSKKANSIDADVIFEISLRMHVQPKYLDRDLTLAIIVTPTALSDTDLQYNLFASPSTPVSQSRFSVASQGSSSSISPALHKRSRDQLLTSLLLKAERDAEVTQTPLRQVLVPLRIVQPLLVTSHAFFTGNTSFVSINVANVHETRPLEIQDVRLHLSSTRWVSNSESRKNVFGLKAKQTTKEVGDDSANSPFFIPEADREWFESSGTKTGKSSLRNRDSMVVDSIDRAFQAVMPFYQKLPLTLLPQEKQHFVVRVEPITGKGLGGVLSTGIRDRRRIGDARSDLRAAESLSGSFESMISVSWDLCSSGSSGDREEKKPIDLPETVSFNAILTRKSAWWSRPTVEADEFIVDIDCPSITRCEQIFVAEVTVKNNSPNSDRIMDCTVVVDPIHGFDGALNKENVLPSTISSESSGPPSPMSFSRSSSPPLTPPREKPPTPPDGMTPDWASSFNAVCIDGDKTRLSMGTSGTVLIFVSLAGLTIWQQQDHDEMSEDLSYKSLVGHWSLRKLQWGVSHDEKILYVQTPDRKLSLLVERPEDGKDTHSRKPYAKIVAAKLSSAAHEVLKKLRRLEKNKRRKSEVVDPDSGVQNGKDTHSSSIPESVSSMESVMFSTQRAQQSRMSAQEAVRSNPTGQLDRMIASPEAVIAALGSNKGKADDKVSNKTGERQSFSLLCLQSTVKLGRIAPGDTVKVTLHFLPLKRGVVQLDSFRLIDSISGEQFGLQKPFTISIVGEELDRLVDTIDEFS